MCLTNHEGLICGSVHPTYVAPTVTNNTRKHVRRTDKIMLCKCSCLDDDRGRTPINDRMRVTPALVRRVTEKKGLPPVDACNPRIFHQFPLFARLSLYPIICGDWRTVTAPYRNVIGWIISGRRRIIGGVNELSGKQKARRKPIGTTDRSCFMPLSPSRRIM